MAKVHVVYDGRTEDLDFSRVFPPERFARIGIPEGTEITASNLTEQQVKSALARFYDVELSEFNDHHVSFDPTGNITVRAEAEFA